MRNRLCEAYTSQHTATGAGGSAAFICRRDIRPMLPSQETGPVVDIGCGQGELVRLMVADGYDARGIAVSPEQVAIAHASDLNQVQQGYYRDILALGMVNSPL